MTDDDLTDRLRRIGSEPGPPPDQAFADGLDSRLRVLHAERAGGSTRPAFPTWLPLATVAAAVLVVAVGVSLLRSSPPAEVVMTVASDTDIYLPGDETTPGVAGLVLPDGARIVVGPEGEAVVDGVVLASGTEAIVVGDHIAVVATDEERSAGIQPSTAPSSTEGRSTSSTTTIESDRPPVTDRPATTATSTSAPPSTATSAPSTRPPTTSSTVTSSTPSSRPTTVTTTSSVSPTTEPPTQPIALTASAIGDTRVRLDWVLERGDEPAGWRVRAAAGDRVVTIVALRDGAARSTTIERLTIAEVTVWVEALGTEGRVLGHSNRIQFR